MAASKYAEVDVARALMNECGVRWGPDCGVLGRKDLARGWGWIRMTGIGRHVLLFDSGFELRWRGGGR